MESSLSLINSSLSSNDSRESKVRIKLTKRSLSMANLMMRSISEEENLLTKGFKESTPVPLVLLLVEMEDLRITTTDPP